MGKPSSRLFVGIETGGTKIVCRVVDEAGLTVAETRFATVAPERVVETLIETIQGALPDDGVIGGVGIASFGPVIVDPAAVDLGRMLATTKPGWSGFNLLRALADRLHAPVAIDTDVGAAALAEQALGAGRGLHTVAYVTVGTGIGGGLALGGHTLRGALHPEIGHVPLRRMAGDTQPSLCAFHADCAEGLVAGPAVQVRLAGRTLAQAPEVKALVANYVGQVCATLLLTWSPQRIVLGGGVMSEPDLVSAIQTALRIELNGYGAGVIAQAPDYLVAAELEHAGLEGALMMARRVATSI